MTATVEKQTDKCEHCDSKQGFYRLGKALWCNGCGHRKGKRKELAHAPTTAPEIALKVAA